MNFLQLAQKLASESGTLQDGVITTVTGQTGRKGKVCRWIADAWRAIQNAHQEWRWMESEFELALSASTRRYAYGTATDTLDSGAIDRFQRWIFNSDPESDSGITLYDSSTGLSDEGVLLFREWDHFYKSFMRGEQTEGKPNYFTVTPQNELAFHSIPDGNDYVAIGRYQKSAQTLSADADEPECPAQYHDVIVDVAMMLLETFDENPGRITLLLLRRSAAFLALERDQLPNMILPDAIA